MFNFAIKANQCNKKKKKLRTLGLAAMYLCFIYKHKIEIHSLGKPNWHLELSFSFEVVLFESTSTT